MRCVLILKESKCFLKTVRFCCVAFQKKAYYTGTEKLFYTRGYADVEMKRSALEKRQRKMENEHNKLPQCKTDEEILKDYTGLRKLIIPIESKENSSLYRKIVFYQNNKTSG